jgi:predicted dehydrogenase
VIERALVVGLGSIGARHLRLLREALPHADIRVLRRSRSANGSPDADGEFDSLDAACAFAPQLAIIANPAPFHVAAASALARAGAHLLVEKPISNSVVGVPELVAQCAAQRQILQVGYNLRFLETLQRFRDEVRSGSVGTIHACRCEVGQFLPGWRPSVDYRESASARADLGGGALLELSHELDMLRWVYGEITSVGAWIGRQSALEIDVEDCVAMQLLFSPAKSGLPGVVAQVSLDFLRHDTTRICTAIGEKGTLRWDAVAGTVTRYDPGTGVWQELQMVKPDRDASYRAQIAALLRSIETGEAPMIAATGQDGLAVIELIDAARGSAKAGGLQTAVKGGTTWA